MIQSLTSQPASMLSGLLSGFTAKDQKSQGDKPGIGAGHRAAQNNKIGAPGAAVETHVGVQKATKAPDGVPALVAQAFPDFAQLALGIVDRASLGTAAGGAQAEAENALFTQITKILGPAQGPGSLSDSIDAAQAAIGIWRATPDEPSARDAALATLKGVVGQTADAISGLSDLSKSLDDQITRESHLVQSGLKRLMAANDRVIAAAGTSDAKAAQTERTQALQALSEHVHLTFQDRPDGALVPVAADGSVLPDDLGDVSADTLRNGLTGGRLKALVDMRQSTLPDLMRQARAIAAGLTTKLNQVSAASPQSNMRGIDTGLGANERLSVSGATSFVVVDAQGQVQSAVTIDFSARTRRGLGVPPQGVQVSTPAQLTKAVSDGLKGQAALTFKAGVFALESLSDKLRVAVVGQDRGDGDRSFTAISGLGRLIDGPTAEANATGFSLKDAHEFPEGQILGLTLDGPGGKKLSADIEVGGKSFQELLDRINDPATGLGSVQILSLDKDGALTKAVANGWVGARLSVTKDIDGRAETGRGFASLFGLDAPIAPTLAPGADFLSLADGRPVIDDKTRRGSPLMRADNAGLSNRLGAALSAEVIVPASLGKPTRMLGLSEAARDLAASAADRAKAASIRQSDARSFGLALKDERGRLSSASFGAELSHLAGLQTARNVSGRLEANATGLIAHLNRAAARKLMAASTANELAA